MSKQNEKRPKEPNKFTDEKSDALRESKEDLENMFRSFLPQRPSWGNEITEDNAESSYDYLTLANSAASQKAALKYAKKAAELDPDNLDAAAAVAELTASSIEKLLEKYKGLIDKANEKLNAQGYFGDRCMGEFWLISETRPYMRLLDRYADCLIQCGRMRLAVAEYEKMLRLCVNDNLGARYRLMHLYVFLEDEQSALNLFNKYPEDDTQFLLPLSILYYKLGNLRESNQYLKKLCSVNKDTYTFLSGVSRGDLDEYIEEMEEVGAYRPFTVEEFLAEGSENMFLFECSTAYFEWAWQKVKTKNK